MKTRLSGTPDMLLPLAGQPVDAGAVVLVTLKLWKARKLAKALSEADAYHNARALWARLSACIQ